MIFDTTGSLHCSEIEWITHSARGRKVAQLNTLSPSQHTNARTAKAPASEDYQHQPSATRLHPWCSASRQCYFSLGYKLKLFNESQIPIQSFPTSDYWAGRVMVMHQSDQTVFTDSGTGFHRLILTLISFLFSFLNTVNYASTVYQICRFFLPHTLYISKLYCIISF